MRRTQENGSLMLKCHPVQKKMNWNVRNSGGRMLLSAGTMSDFLYLYF